MSLCFAHAGNIVRNIHALSFVVHFSIKKAFFKKNYDQRIAMHISENIKELYFSVTYLHWICKETLLKTSFLNSGSK